MFFRTVPTELELGVTRRLLADSFGGAEGINCARHRFSHGKLDSHAIAIENEMFDVHVCNICAAATGEPRHNIEQTKTRLLLAFLIS